MFRFQTKIENDSKAITKEVKSNSTYESVAKLQSGHVMEWNGMEDGMEEEFWYGIWKTSGMERNGRF